MNILVIILQETKNAELTKLLKPNSEPISLLMPIVIISLVGIILGLIIFWFGYKKKNQ